MLVEETTQAAATGVVLQPGEGERTGLGMNIRLRSEQTNGVFAAVEAQVPPRTQGPGLHMHTREDEILYILEGALRVRIGDERYTAPAGALVYLPREVPHTFCNPFDEPVRMFGTISPGGFERFFEEQAQIFAAVPEGGRPDFAAMEALAHKYGGVLLGPPMSLDE